MLNLEFKNGQTVTINENITIRVSNTSGFGRIRLAIDAPAEVPIRREHLKRGKINPKTYQKNIINRYKSAFREFLLDIHPHFKYISDVPAIKEALDRLKYELTSINTDETKERKR